VNGREAPLRIFPRPSSGRAAGGVARDGVRPLQAMVGPIAAGAMAMPLALVNDSHVRWPRRLTSPLKAKIRY
jgi:hypothetical protein